MSFLSANTSFETYRQDWDTRQGLQLMEQFCNISHFLCRLRHQMRYGELTRAPLKLLRLELVDETVECDLLARPQDPWDVGLPQRIGLRHTSLQTLRDAIDVRNVVFRTFAGIDIAYLRIYRDSPDNGRELIVTGNAQRNDNSSRWVHSLAMRAKVLGFRFHLEDEILHGMSRGTKTFAAAK